MPDYGKLSKRALDDMLAGARVEVAEYKRYAGDFILWKPAAGQNDTLAGFYLHGNAVFLHYRT